MPSPLVSEPRRHLPYYAKVDVPKQHLWRGLRETLPSRCAMSTDLWAGPASQHSPVSTRKKRSDITVGESCIAGQPGSQKGCTQRLDSWPCVFHSLRKGKTHQRSLRGCAASLESWGCWIHRNLTECWPCWLRAIDCSCTWPPHCGLPEECQSAFYHVKIPEITDLKKERFYFGGQRSQYLLV